MRLLRNTVLTLAALGIVAGALQVAGVVEPYERVAVPVANEDAAALGLPQALVDTGPHATLIAEFLPKLRQVCPGLELFSDDLAFEEIQHNFDFAPDGAKRLEVVYVVSDKPAVIPRNFLAAGNRCFFGVSPTGDSLMIGKVACVSVCKGHRHEGAGDFVEPI